MPILKRPAMAGKNRTRIFLVVCIALSLAFLPAVLSAETLKDYEEGGGKFGCLPPEDKSPCEPGPPPIGGPARTILHAYYECAKMTKDPAVQKKFVILAALMATGPHGMVVAGTYAAKEGLEEFLQCAWKGWIEAGDGTREEKDLAKDMVKKAFDTKDYATVPKDIFRGDFLNKESLDGAARAFEVTADAEERYREFEKFDGLFRNLSEAYHGIPERARNYLGDIDALVGSCRFGLAWERANEAERIMDTYCRSKGTGYRKLEKEVRCYRERNAQRLEIEDRDAMSRYGSPLRPKLDEMQGNLETFREGLLGDLGLFKDIERKKSFVVEKSGNFDKIRASYLTTCVNANGFLSKGDLNQACAAVDKLMAIEGTQNLDCAKSLRADGTRECRGGAEALELSLNRAALDLEQKVDEWLTQAERGIGACKLADAPGLLEKARQNWPLIWSYTGGGCQASRKAAAFADRYKELSSRFGGIKEQADKYARAAESGKQLAGDLCTYELALSNLRSEDLLWDLGKRGCVSADRIEQDIKTIKDLQQGSSARAEAVMKSLLDQIEEVKKRLPGDAKPLRCEINEDGLERVRLSAISQLCTDLSPLPDSAKARAEKVNAEIQAAKRSIQEGQTKQKNAASAIIEKALSGAQADLDSCFPAGARERLRKLGAEVQANCLTAEQARQRDSLISEAAEFDRDLQKRRHGIEVLGKEAEKTLQSCDWEGFNNQTSEAGQTFPPADCNEKYPAFTDLSKRLEDLKARARERRARQEAFSNKGFGLMAKIDKALLEKWERDGFWTSAHQANFMRNLEPLRQLQGEVAKEGMRECLSNLMNDIDDIVARARRLPLQSEPPGGGFSSAGEGRTEGGSTRTTKDEDREKGFSPAGAGETKGSGEGSGGFSGGGPGQTISGPVPVQPQPQAMDMRCQQAEGQFWAAYRSGNLQAAWGIVNSVPDCGFAGEAAGLLREQMCFQFEQRLLAAVQARNVALAQGVIGEAQQNGCTLSPQGIQLVQEMAQMQQRGEQRRQLEQFNEALRRFDQGISQPPFPPPIPQPDPRLQGRQTIPMPPPQPQPTNPPVIPQPAPGPQAWQTPPQPQQAQRQQVFEAERKAMANEIRAAGDRWAKKFCEPARRIQSCNVLPARAVNDLLYRLENNFATREHLNEMRRLFSCYDACMNALQSLGSPCQQRCLDQQKPSPGTGFGVR
jgi:hypothetical protein